MEKFWKLCLGVAFSGLMLVGVSTPGFAQGSGENFSVDESCGDPAAAGFCSDVDFVGTGSVAVPEFDPVITDVDRINFTYNASVDQNINGGALNGEATDNFFEDGFIDYSAYIDDSGGIISSFLNTPEIAGGYGLYATFTATGTATATGGGGIDVDFASFTINIYIDDDQDTVLTLPDDPENDDVDRANITDDHLVALATLLGAADAELDAGLANGDFAVVLTDFGLSMFGEDFFVDPDPFYAVMELDGNTSQVGLNACPATVAVGGTDRLIDSTTGFGAANLTTDFKTCLTGSGQMFFKLVPEPSTLGLMGIGLTGIVLMLGFGARRRSQAA